MQIKIFLSYTYIIAYFCIVLFHDDMSENGRFRVSEHVLGSKVNDSREIVKKKFPSLFGIAQILFVVCTYNMHVYIFMQIHF